jgi:hypothetical protein
MSRVYAGVLGFVAFAVAIARSTLDGQGVSTALPYACGALTVFAVVGAIAGKVADTVVAESVQQDLRIEIEAHQRAVVNHDRSGRSV